MDTVSNEMIGDSCEVAGVEVSLDWCDSIETNAMFR